MTEVSRRQIRTLRRQIRNVYGRYYIPLTTATTTLSMGDILKKRRTTSVELDGSLLSIGANEITTGTKVNRNFMTTSSVDVTFKASGRAAPANMGELASAKAGLIVEFENETSMFLKVLGLHEQSIKDFGALRDKVIDNYVSGRASARAFVVRGLVVADRFFLQFGGKKSGRVGIELEADTTVSAANAKLDAAFNVVWSKSVGFDVDADRGGPLAYRVSAVRVRRHKRPEQVTKAVMKGASEAEALDDIPVSERGSLFDADALEVSDCTNELILDLES